jgi:hypothetical protein
MANATATQLQQLYIAYFGRAADPSGLDYWVGKGTTTKSFAASMYAQDEFKNVNGSLSTELQVNQIYQNLFGRDADAAGLIYWTNQIKTGALELASIANDLIYAVNNGSSATDLTALNNKSSAATAFTADVRESNSALLAYQPKSTSPFVVGANFETAKTFFKTVTATNSVTDAEVQTQVNTIAANSGNTSATTELFSLTTGVDEPEAGKYNKIDGSLNSSGIQTLNSLDKLQGTTGASDVLNATISRSVTPLLISDIETVNIGATAAATLGLVNSTGISKVNIGGVTGGAFTLTGIGQATDISISDSTQNHTITFNDVSGTSDTADITVAQLTGNTNTDLTVAGIESINLVSAGGEGSNDFELIATSLETLTLTGSGAITLPSLTTAGTDSLSKIDFSGYAGSGNVTTGALDIGLTNLTVLGGSGNDTIDTSAFVSADTSVSGGAGNDSITIALATTDTLVGGDGTDTLSTSTAVATAANVSGFETLEITGAVSQDMDNLTGNTWTTVNFGGNVATTVSDASADIATLVLNSDSQDTKTFSRKTDTSSDSIAVTLKNTAASNLSVVNEETINITSSGAASTITTLTADDVTKITVAGSENTTITNVAGII